MDLHRRSFFRALLGLPAAAAVGAALPEPARATVSQPARALPVLSFGESFARQGIYCRLRLTSPPQF
jgi:hypothetical protein